LSRNSTVGAVGLSEDAKMLFENKSFPERRSTNDFTSKVHNGAVVEYIDAKESFHQIT
jgi:hypothetical protein